MSKTNETSSDEGGEQRITVRRLAPVRHLTSRQMINAVRETANGREIHALSVAVVDDATITSLHQRYLDDATPTDVITFDLRDDDHAEAIDGEIVLSAETARRQSRRLGKTEAQEVLRYIIHGTLHLLGYDDHTPAGRSRMRRTENRVLARLNLGRTPVHRSTNARAFQQRRPRGSV